MSKRKLILIGDSAFAEIAFEYFTHDSDYEVVAFSVERAFIKKTTLCGLPVIAFEDIQDLYLPKQHSIFVAIVYTQLNRLRTRFYLAAKSKGYSIASYISSHAFVWKNVKIGEHCFIFENNVVQPFVTLKDNVILWSGNHIGHHSVIEENCFISSHVVVSGYVHIGKSCFLGVNSTLVNNISIGEDCLIGAGATVSKDIEPDKVVKASATEGVGSAKRLLKVKESILCGASEG